MPTGPLETNEHWWREWSLQCVALGLFLADREKSRDHQPNDLFSSTDLQNAYIELRNSITEDARDFNCLDRFLEENCGVRWNGKGKVIDAILRQLRQDADINRWLRSMSCLLESDDIKRTPESKQRFLDGVKELIERERQRLLPPDQAGS